MKIQRSEISMESKLARKGSGRAWLESVSSGMRTVEAVIRELSQNDVPVLVVAESGAGKEAAAERIHVLSKRASERFNVCQGADASKDVLAGCEEQGGTVYLQEVGDLNFDAQTELVELLGSQMASVPRFICGTSRELEPEVKA